MDGGGEGRCISEVAVLEVFQSCAHGQSDNTDIGDLVNGTLAQDLQAQQFVGCLVGDQLDDEGIGAGIIVGLVVGNDNDSLNIHTQSQSFLLGQTCAAHVDAGQLGNACAEDTGMGQDLTAGKASGGNAAADVGGGAHSRPAALAGQTMCDDGTVTAGIDIGVIGAHVAVDDQSALDHFQAAFGEETCVGTEAQRQDAGISLHGALAGLYLLDLGLAQDGFQANACEGHDAFFGQAVFNITGHFCIQQIGQNLRCDIDEGNLNLACSQVFGNFQTDQAAADNDGALDGTAVDRCLEGIGIFGRAHVEDVLQVDAGNIGTDGGSTDSDDQLVVAMDGLNAVADSSNGLGRTIKGGDFGVVVDLSAGQRLKALGGVDEELLALGNDLADIVGQAAAGVGDILGLGQDDDLSGGIFTTQLGSCLGTGSNAADDDDLHNRQILSMLDFAGFS